MSVQKTPTTSDQSPASIRPDDRGHAKTAIQAYSRPLSRAAVLSRLVGHIVEQVRSLRDRLVKKLTPSRQSGVLRAQDFGRSRAPSGGPAGPVRLHPQPMQNFAAYAAEARQVVDKELTALQAATGNMRSLALPGEEARSGFEFAEQMWKDSNRSKYTSHDGDKSAVLYQLGDPAAYGGPNKSTEEHQKARDAILAFAEVTTGGDLARLNTIARYAQQGLAASLMQVARLPDSPLTLEGQPVMPITLSGDTEVSITKEATGTHQVRISLSPTAETLFVNRCADKEMLALPAGSTIRAEMTIRVNLDGTAELVDVPKVSMTLAPGKIMTMDEHTAQAQSTILKVT